MGQIIGDKYEITAEIGRGGMGMVYRGINIATRHPVAIKRLKSDNVQFDPTILERFRREAEALAKLNHPNITKVLDTIETGNDHYIIMEYYGRGDLNDVIRNESPLSMQRVLTIAIELADALTRAHYLNIIHRDIKPANVLIADDGSPRLTDFGVAHFGSKEPMTGVDATVGTLAYLSPEALGGEVVDPRSDIWSFGVMLFEMIAGRHPFSSDTIMGAVKAIMTQPIPDLEALREDCPVEVVDLVNRMLEKERDARIPSVRLIGAELEHMIRKTDESTILYTAALAQHLARPRFDMPTSGGSTKNNLPPQTTPFVGREQELNQLTSLLSEPETRLMTILAPGGMGKTRLALETASQFIQKSIRQTSRHHVFVNGVFLIELAPLTDPAAIISALADATGFTFQQDGREPKQQILDYLREKRMLLVLDNFEHLLEGAMFASEILRAAEHVKIVATSRERLNLQEEILFRLEGFDFPKWKSLQEALEFAPVKLFMQGARRAQPGFELTPNDLPLVAQICRMVDGVPLPILLASAWLDSLTLPEIADEIRKSIDFLATDARNVPERQRSVRAIFDYSWNLLTEAERTVLTSLSVFRGGCSREAAQAVTGATLRELTALVNKSLLHRDVDTGRYSLHELLRQYLDMRLQEYPPINEAIRERYVAYYAAFVTDNHLKLIGKGAAPVLAMIDDDLENIHAAWRQLVEKSDFVEVEKLLIPLMSVYEIMGRYTEGMKLFRDAIERLTAQGAPQDGTLLWRLRTYTTMLDAQAGGMIDEAVVRQSLKVFRQHDSSRDINLALNVLAFGLIRRGQYAEAKTYAEEATALLQHVSDPLADAMTLGNLGYVNFLSGDYPEARRITELDVQRADASGNMVQMARSRNSLGEIFHEMNDEPRAKELFEESYALSMAIHNRPFIASAATNIGKVLHRMGHYKEAGARYEESLEIHQEIGNRRGVAESSNRLAGVWVMLGDYARAVPYHEQAYRQFQEIGEKRGMSDSLALLNAAELFLGDYASGIAHAEETLSIRRELGNPMEITDALALLSRSYMFSGNFEKAEQTSSQMIELANRIEALRFPITNIYNGILTQLRLVQEDYAGSLAIVEPSLPALDAYGQGFVIAITYYSVGRARLGLGRYEDAERALRRSIAAALASHSDQWAAASFAELAMINAAKGDEERAVEHLCLVLSNDKLPHWISTHVQAQLDALRDRLSADAFAAASARGATRDLEATIREVMAG